MIGEGTVDGWFVSTEGDGEYFVTEYSDGTVVWVGEDPAPMGRHQAYANVFIGARRDENRIVGDLIDVPKGRIANDFREVTVLHEEPSGYTQLRVGLPRPFTLRAPGSMGRDWPVASRLEQGCGFYDAAIDTEIPPRDHYSLTGVWTSTTEAGAFSGVYYVRQVGERVVWFGEDQEGRFANVFDGRLTGRTLSGSWWDVPKGWTRNRGTLSMNLNGIAPFDGFFTRTQLTRTNQTGGFGGHQWRKTDTVHLAAQLDELFIVRNADEGGLNRRGDEPYLIPAGITFGGDQYPDARSLLDPTANPGIELVLPPERHPLPPGGKSWPDNWPKNNLTWQEDLVEGTRVVIPDFVTYWEGTLRTFAGMEPNHVLAQRLPNIVYGAFGVEEASTHIDDVRAGLRAILETAPRTIHEEMAEFLVGVVTSLGAGSLVPPIDDIEATLRKTAFSAMADSAKSNLIRLLGAFDPDKYMGFEHRLFDFGRLRGLAVESGVESSRSGLVEPFEFRGSPHNNGHWQSHWSATASLNSPVAHEIHELEVTVLTGDDDKREDSRVEYWVTELPDREQGPFPLHPDGQRFADQTLHTARTQLMHPIPVGRHKGLRLRWWRGPGSGLRGDDSWVLSKIRVVGYDAKRRRRVLIEGRPINKKFVANGDYVVPFARG